MIQPQAANDVIGLTAALGSSDSVNLSLIAGAAGESAIADFVARWAADSGLRAETLTGPDGRPSVVARRGLAGGPVDLDRYPLRVDREPHHSVTVTIVMVVSFMSSLCALGRPRGRPLTARYPPRTAVSGAILVRGCGDVPRRGPARRCVHQLTSSGTVGRVAPS